jgi:hypothetical protein
MTHVTAAQNIKNRLKPSIKSKKTEELKSKPMHGQFYQEPERPWADKEKSLVWICSSGLKFNNSSPDRALSTLYHQRNITTQQTDSKCSLCYTA